MYECLCRCENYYKLEYAFTFEEFKTLDFISRFEDKNVGKKYKSIFMTFDIETSKIKDETKSLIQKREVYEGFTYAWQVCFNGVVIFLSSWTEFKAFLSFVSDYYKLKENKLKMVIYVHNLAFEFMFASSFLEFKKIFATDKRMVLKADYDCFEFRCSYRLTNMNLAKTIENSPNAHHFKALEDLDYNVVRTSIDDVDEYGLGYIFNDVRGLWEAIKDKLIDDTLATIPLTSTGYVRRDCRNAMRKNKANRKEFLKSTLNLEEYRICKKAFRGGNTASNRYYTNKVLYNLQSYDFSSDYPFQIMTRDFPSGKCMHTKIKSFKDLRYFNSKYLTIGHYFFENIHIKDNIPIPYIPYSKCEKCSKETAYNGRILNAEMVSIYLTNIDFSIIEKQYDYDAIYVTDFIFWRKKKLPKELRERVMAYFEGKSTLRGIYEKLYEYMKSKERLNAIFGMMVTDILHESYCFVDNKWKIDDKKTEQEKLDKYNTSYNSFLCYQWGVFVTAWARLQLQEIIDIIGMDSVYNDTDSVKCINEHYGDIQKFNEQLLNGVILKNDIVPIIEHNSKKYIMGIMDMEDGYEEFKTLGAKKYAYKQKGKYGLTVAGLSKKKGAEELARCGGLDAFQIGHIFLDSGRTGVQYNYDDIHFLTVNGQKIINGNNIAIYDETYTLGVTDTMYDILKAIERGEE